MDDGGKFISVKFRLFCKKQGITIRYAALYMHEENDIAKRNWHTIMMIKDFMLIDSGLLNRFWAEAIKTTNYL